jgi:hypothetical protein
LPNRRINLHHKHPRSPSIWKEATLQVAGFYAATQLHYAAAPWPGFAPPHTAARKSQSRASKCALTSKQLGIKMGEPWHLIRGLPANKDAGELPTLFLAVLPSISCYRKNP